MAKQQKKGNSSKGKSGGKGSSSNSENRRSYVGMMLITTAAILASFFALRYGYFQPKVKQGASTTAEATADSGEKESAPNYSEGNVSAELESSMISGARASLLNAPARPERPEGLSGISYRDADFVRSSVGSREERDGYTAVFTSRGGNLALLSYKAKTGEGYETVFARSPLSPMDKPEVDKVEAALLLTGPWAVLRTWRPSGDGVVAANPRFRNATIDQLTNKNDALFNYAWASNFFARTNGKMVSLAAEDFSADQRAAVQSGEILTLDGNAWTERTPAFSFATPLGERDWRNEVEWTATTLKDNEDGSQSISFTCPADSDGVVVTKHYTLYPGFKIVCELELKRAGSSEDQEPTAVKRALVISGAPGIRQDRLQSAAAEAVGIVSLYSHPKGFTLEEDEVTSGSLRGEQEDYADLLTERGKTVNVKEIPASFMYGVKTDDEKSVMLSGIANGYFVSALGLDYLPLYRYDDWGGRQGSDILFPPFAVDEDSERAVAATFNFPPVSLKPGESVKRRLVMYVGPRDDDFIDAAFQVARPVVENAEGDASWDGFMNTSWVPALSRPISWLLRVLDGWIGSVGWAIILLTLIIRIGMSPLSVKGQMSMQIHGNKMRKIKPKLDEVRAKYKEDKSREAQMLMFQETRAVMKQAGVSFFPFGGCLPLLLQFPIFIALYNSVRSSFLLRHENFLWINDLSRPDALFGAIQSDGGMLFFLAANGYITLNILPIIWVLLIIVQQKLQPKPTDPQQAKMQRNMMFVFPLMGLFFYAMPAGFTLYFVASSIYSFVEIRLVKAYLRWKGLIDPPEKPDKSGKDDKPKVTVEPAT